MTMQLRALTLAIGLCTAQAWAATPAAPDVVKDPKGAWAHFLANGSSVEVQETFAVRDAIGYSMTDADVTKCKDNAAALDDALTKVPVSIAYHRMAMLCAVATGNDARAEREFQAVAALSKYALASASESQNAAPVRVVLGLDVNALLASTGLEHRYAYYPLFRAERDFPIIVATWDPERKLERHLQFDWTDTWVRIIRDLPVKYPMLRVATADAFVESEAKANVPQGVDVVTLRQAIQSPEAERTAVLRAGVEAGGILSAVTWAFLCEQPDADKDCADGYVEALLPMAEKQYALPMTILAYAYAQGLGVKADEAAAMKLLDGADAHWIHDGASSTYIDMWMTIHGDKPLPPALVQRLARAVQAGNEDAPFLQMKDALHRDPNFKPDAKQIAYLRSDVHNGRGEGYAWLAARMDEDAADTKAIVQLAAEHGDAESQATMATRALGWDGDPRDDAAARKWLELAAHGGNKWAANYRGYLARIEGDGAGAQGWLFAPATAGDIPSQLDIADAWSMELPGVSGTKEQAMALRRDLAKISPVARRRLATVLMNDEKEKNPAEARTLLQQDADAGDHDSEAMLGLGLLHGTLGKVDEAAGAKWVERAIAGGATGAASDYAYWLFYRKATDKSRAQALTLWRAHSKKSSTAANNLAWALCTSDIAAMRDPKAGMDAVKDMGNVQSLEFGEQDTVAACQAANGDFDGALALQKQVNAQWHAQIRNVKSTPAQEKQTKEFDKRLALYEAKQPYIEAAADRE